MLSLRNGSGLARNIFENRHRPSFVSSEASFQEIVMASTRKMPRLSYFAFATVPAIAALLAAGHALASQGPGGGPGTASSYTQLAMALLVYGTSALVVGIGLIGMARRR